MRWRDVEKIAYELGEGWRLHKGPPPDGVGW